MEKVQEWGNEPIVSDDKRNLLILLLFVWGGIYEQLYDR